MSNNVLEVKSLTKSFKTYSSEIKRVLSWFGMPFKPTQNQQILHNINFNVSAGEAIGIIGQNGAGKSTLLKIITGVLRPSSGEIVVRGKIAAILELGMGFHPDLTGRQNAYHSAGLMGYSDKEINSVIEEINEFSEIGEYFDQPVRLYSSGMQMRVAFAVATAFRPDILIVDEALSVGDSYFQHKSLNRVRELQEQGTTLLLVSHDRGAIQAICNRAILLEKGTVIKDGNPEEVMDFYNALIAEKENGTIKQVVKENGKVETISGTGEATVEEIALYNSKNEIVEFVGVGECIELRVQVRVHKDVESLVVMYGTNTWHTDQVIENPIAGDIYNFTLSFHANFGPESYSIQTALTDKDTHLSANYEWKDLALIFNVINIDKTYFVGCSWNEPKIKVEKCV